MRTHSWFCAVCVLTGACGASSQVERVRDARMEMIDEQAVEETRVVKERQAARENVIEQRHDLAKTNLEKGEGSSQSTSEAALDTSKERALFEAEARGRVETVAVRIEAARKMLGALNGKAPDDARAKLDGLESARELMQTEVQELATAPAGTWDIKKQLVDDRITRLDARVDELASELESI